MAKIAYALGRDIEYTNIEVPGILPADLVVRALRIKYALYKIEIKRLDQSDELIHLVVATDLPRPFTQIEFNLALDRLLDLAEDPRCGKMCPDCHLNHDCADILLDILGMGDPRPYAPHARIAKRPKPMMVPGSPFGGFSAN